jgi:hypothetical protein
VEVGVEGSTHLKAFERVALPKKGSIRLAFLMTVYRDSESVMRLLRHLYSPRHCYLVNIDSSSKKLATELRALIRTLGPNVFIANETPVVYMASSASKILVQGMAWFLSNVQDFNYLISCTGSDYPLLPLASMEAVLTRRSPPHPSVMNWNFATWQDSVDMEGLFSAEGLLAKEEVLRERRPPNSPMESRGNDTPLHTMPLEFEAMYLFYSVIV